MITTDMIQAGNRHIDEATAQYLADLWNTAYPHLRAALTDTINFCRSRPGPEHTKSLKRYETIRRELGQLDRGAHRGCGRMTPAFYASSAATVVGYAVRSVSFDDAVLGDIYRLAAELCDQKAAWLAAIKTEIAHENQES